MIAARCAIIVGMDADYCPQGHDRNVVGFYPKKNGWRQCKQCLTDQRRRHRTKPEYRARANARRSREILALKQETFAAYGGAKCACCGEEEIAFLQLDHVDGGGSADRFRRGWVDKHGRTRGASGHAVYRQLRKEGWPPGYQVLCANCNMAKGVNGVCPHQRADVDIYTLNSTTETVAA